MILVAPLLLALAGPSPATLTLPGALRQAAATSAQADVARSARAAAHAGSARVRALYLPALNVTAGYRALAREPELVSRPTTLGPLGLGMFTIPAFTVPGQVNPVEERDSWRYRATLRWLVCDFGRRGGALAASRALEDAVGFAGEDAVRRDQGEVAARYLALLDVGARRRVVAQRRESLERHLEDARSLLEHGVVARNDVLRTEVALRAVGDADQALERSSASLLEELNVAMGLPGATPQALPDSLGEPPTLPWDETTCRARAAAGNAAVKAQRAKLEALERQARVRRLDRLPNVVAEASHAWAENRYVTREDRDELLLGVSWDLFDGGAREALVHQADAEREQARRELVEAVRRSENAASSALRDYEQARHETGTARADVAATEENLRIVGDQYREGLIRGSEVLDAEATLAEARTALAERRYRAYAQQIALLTVLGEDVPAFYETHAEEK
jgi:outer membrane protein TolC